MPQWCSCGSNRSVQRASGQHIGEYCAVCDKWLRWIPQDWSKFVWPVGAKHKGKTLAFIVQNDRPYVEWAAKEMKGTLQKRAQEALDVTTYNQGVAQGGPEEEDSYDRIARHSEPRKEEPAPRNSDWDDVPW